MNYQRNPSNSSSFSMSTWREGKNRYPSFVTSTAEEASKKNEQIKNNTKSELLNTWKNAPLPEIKTIIKRGGKKSNKRNKRSEKKRSKKTMKRRR